MTEFGVKGLVKLSSALLRAATTGSGIDGAPYNDVGLREVEGVGFGETGSLVFHESNRLRDEGEVRVSWSETVELDL